MSEIDPIFQAALAACDSAPLRTPDRVQPFSALVAVDLAVPKNADRPPLAITRASENLGAVVGVDGADCLGRALRDVFPSRLEHAIANARSLVSIRQRREPIDALSMPDRTVEVFGHVAGDSFILEFEPQRNDEAAQTTIPTTVNRLLDRVGGTDDLDATLDAAVRWLRVATGFDRVMAYRFDEAYNGEVVAEARSGRLEPYLGLRFPAWDIPPIARAVMKQVPLRVIPDVDATPAALLAHEGGREPLDLSLALSRGVAEVHLQYLRNMAVRGSMTLSIVVEDRLWGLLAFHHGEPRLPSANIRAIGEMFVQMFNAKIALLLEREARGRQDRFADLRVRVFEDPALEEGVDAVLRRSADTLMTHVQAHGFAYRIEGAWTQFGATPAPAMLDHLAEAVGSEAGGVFAHDALSALDAMAAALTEDAHALEGTAGVLAVDIPDRGDTVAMLFREERVRSVDWAGAPDKTVRIEDGDPILHPRRSFARYTEEVRGRSAPWTEADRLFARDLRAALSRSSAAQDRLLRQQELMIAELNHRVRNILTLVRSVSRQARQHNNTLASYSMALENRIRALAAAHNLASGSSVRQVSMREIIDVETRPHLGGGARVRVSGVDVGLRPNVSPIFALVAHELVTNAVKYGALSAAQGAVAVTLARGEGGLAVSWVERGGPPVSPPGEKAFGMALIERAVPYEMNGRAALHFEPEGLRAEFWIPDAMLGDGTDAPAPTRSPVGSLAEYHPDAPSAPPGFSGAALLVEDNLLIAMDMETVLLQFGFDSVDVAADNAAALRFLEHGDYGAAVLDVNLAETSSFATARRLQALGAPFVFLTGCGADALIPDTFADIVVCTKPVEEDALRRALAAAMETAGGDVVEEGAAEEGAAEETAEGTAEGTADGETPR